MFKLWSQCSDRTERGKTGSTQYIFSIRYESHWPNPTPLLSAVNNSHRNRDWTVEHMKRHRGPMNRAVQGNRTALQAGEGIVVNWVLYFLGKTYLSIFAVHVTCNKPMLHASVLVLCRSDFRRLFLTYIAPTITRSQSNCSAAGTTNIKFHTSWQWYSSGMVSDSSHTLSTSRGVNGKWNRFNSEVKSKNGVVIIIWLVLFINNIQSLHSVL